jgi:hypothetical protein
MTSRNQAGTDAQVALPSSANVSAVLPLPGLLTLAMAAFITLMTEIMPAGLLVSMAKGLSISESTAGQFITAYACGALIAAIPVTAFTRGMRRQRLLVAAIAGSAVVNLITAVSGDYQISLGARFVAGVFGGVVWSLLAGYAVRMTPPHLHGRAIAISGAGATVALALGAPAGAWLGRIGRLARRVRRSVRDRLPACRMCACNLAGLSGSDEGSTAESCRGLVEARHPTCAPCRCYLRRRSQHSVCLY